MKALAGGFLLFWAGCALTITSAAKITFETDPKVTPDEVSCGTMLGALAAGIVVDGTIGVTAAVTRETFSTVDKLVIGIASLDVVAATVVVIRECRD